MNANELADMAENACCAYQKEIATMLRQQQAEIEALKELVHQRFDDGKRLGVLETENKFKLPPCAWMVKTNDGKKLMLYGEEQPPKFADEVQAIPLYTHPSEHDLGIAESIGFDKGYKAQADRIAELEKCLFQMQNACINLTKNFEPVAWMDDLGDLEKFNHQNKNWIPLYTTPQIKELSDDEIIELFDHLDDFNCIDFARAILKKASEK